jgi:hypothetical protein
LFLIVTLLIMSKLCGDGSGSGLSNPCNETIKYQILIKLSIPYLENPVEGPRKEAPEQPELSAVKKY